MLLVLHVLLVALMNAHEGIELTYDEVAEILDISPRATRDVLKIHKAICPCIEYSRQKKRFSLADVLKVKQTRRHAAVKKGASK